jgi:hypothetical protein
MITFLYTITIILGFILTAIVFYYIGKYRIENKFRKQLNHRIGVYKTNCLLWKQEPIVVIAEVKEIYKSTKNVCKIEYLGVEIINNLNLNLDAQSKRHISVYIGQYLNEADIDWYDLGHNDRKNKIRNLLNSK